MRVLDWPGNSLDLNLSEACWHRMKVNIAKLRRRPLSKAAMEVAVRAEWDAIPEDFLMELVRTMPERVRDVITTQGEHTKW